MTRKEEICDVTKEQFTYVKDENLKSALRFAFIDGAKWADEHPNLESLWHDASEEPKGDNWKILCVDIYNECWVESRFNALLLHNKWNEYVAIELVKMWAYIDDLLPKQFGNSEQLKGGKK